MAEAYALYAYTAVGEGELSFEEGWVLWVSDGGDPDWWYAQVDDGSEGYVPRSYVQLADQLKGLRKGNGRESAQCRNLPPQDAGGSVEQSEAAQPVVENPSLPRMKLVDLAPAAARSSITSPPEADDWDADMDDDIDTTTYASDYVPPAPSGDFQPGQAYVLYDYLKQNDEELDVYEGELVQVLSQEGEWYDCMNDAGQGFVPCSYVGEITPASASGAFDEGPVPEDILRNWKDFAASKGYNVADLDPAEVSRQMTLHELLVTEGDYLTDLKSIQYHFVDKARAVGVSEDDIYGIFMNVEDLIPIHEYLHQKFNEQRTGASVPAIGEVIQDCFEQMDFSLYGPYMTGYSGSAALAAQFEATNPAFSAILNSQVGGLSLSSWTIKPIQRVMKYPLLIRDLIQRTPDNHPDYSYLVSAVVRIEKTVAELNEMKRAVERVSRGEELIPRLDFSSAPKVYQSFNPTEFGRDFLHDGPVSVAIGKKKKTSYTMVMFNDALFLCTVGKAKKEQVPKLAVKEAIELGDIYVKDVSDDHDVTFTIKAGKDVYTCLAENTTEKIEWLRVLRNTSLLREELQEAAASRITGPTLVRASVAGGEDYKLLYDYTAASDEELTCTAGDIVQVLDKSDPEWYLVSCKVGGTGYVPASYLEVEARKRPRPPSMHFASSSASRAPVPIKEDAGVTAAAESFSQLGASVEARRQEEAERKAVEAEKLKERDERLANAKREREEARQRMEEEKEARRRKIEEEAAQRRAAAEEKAEQLRLQREEEAKRKREESEKKRNAVREAAERARMEAEEARKKEEELARQQAEEDRRKQEARRSMSGRGIGGRGGPPPRLDRGAPWSGGDRGPPAPRGGRGPPGRGPPGRGPPGRGPPGRGPYRGPPRGRSGRGPPRGGFRGGPPVGRGGQFGRGGPPPGGFDRGRDMPSRDEPAGLPSRDADEELPVGYGDGPPTGYGAAAGSPPVSYEDENGPARGYGESVGPPAGNEGSEGPPSGYGGNCGPPAGYASDGHGHGGSGGSTMTSPSAPPPTRLEAPFEDSTAHAGSAAEPSGPQVKLKISYQKPGAKSADCRMLFVACDAPFDFVVNSVKEKYSLTGSITLSYKDEDGDLVALADNEDVGLALADALESSGKLTLFAS